MVQLSWLEFDHALSQLTVPEFFHSKLSAAAGCGHVSQVFRRRTAR